ncbi:class I SAM-dependent methyltransferase [Chengkuizengella axinellae]|uniref:Class I SAM-dependent methyltransferase n=1 Tax=Chengkuizengella axinellae TaxID=3064388 RepID=A0ABT9IY04_9BACL|nr:class I SAM-dependent methyltransferase [Chengkuizengella sp. 2205SS18-9]MDP5274236.1 class I SAM-dependent methyltransferase [Chengkuizengella sp. 2205SS18-9]
MINLNDEKKATKDVNEDIWNEETYYAWVKRFGEPHDAVQKIMKNPAKLLSVLYPKFGNVENKKIMNLMGSNGSKAVALALMGAKVTVADFSEGNKRYAMELAKEANVNIEYILSDVLKISEKQLSENYDIVFAEMGILHYFIDLKPFMEIVNTLLGNHGLFIIRDFHPVSTKLITSRGTTSKIRKHKVTGDYFDTSIEEKEVSYTKYLNDEEPKKVLHRYWNIGEIVTAISNAGLVVKSLDEEPNLSSEVFDKGIPKTFTLVAEKL